MRLQVRPELNSYIEYPECDVCEAISVKVESWRLCAPRTCVQVPAVGCAPSIPGAWRPHAAEGVCLNLVRSAECGPEFVCLCARADAI